MPKPVIDYNLLRRVAETASGYRYENMYFTVTSDDKGNPVITPYKENDKPPCPSEQCELYHVQKVNYGPPPKVVEATIASENASVDLLNVTVPPQQMHPGGTYAADAVFWSASAVEKFLVPYYASVYGDEAFNVVYELLNILRPDTAGGDGGENLASAFAIAHLPNSEYVTLPTEAAHLPRLVVLRMDGTVHPVVNTRSNG